MSDSNRENKLSKHTAPRDLDEIEGLNIKDLLTEERGARTHARTRASTHALPIGAIQEEPEPLALVGLSVRVKPLTYKALQFAMREQKRTGASPASRQDIVETALVEWLKKNRYLS